jgi:hypothetical protein
MATASVAATPYLDRSSVSFCFLGNQCIDDKNLVALLGRIDVSLSKEKLVLQGYHD